MLKTAGILIAIQLIFNPLCFAAGETITITTYYPSPFGSYNKLEANEITLGRTAFVTVYGMESCPDGYEVFTARWEPRKCWSSLPSFFSKCATSKFVWGSDSAPVCNYCIKLSNVPETVCQACIKQGGDKNECCYICNEFTECKALKKEYTICVKMPSANIP